MNQFSIAVALTTLIVSGCVVTVNDRTLIGKDHVDYWNSKIVIAHRGASGYLPEHTLAAKALAYGQGADYIEQDLVMTADDEVIVLHDHHLETVSNVRAVFPERVRNDGRYYVIDFTLPELRRLEIYERFEEHNGVRTPVYPERFPLHQSSFRINTLAEEIELIQGLNQSTGRNVGIYPEIKSPAFHRQAGKDISAAVLRILRDYGYASDKDAVFLQCFDAVELQRIYNELLPQHEMTVTLVQLIGAQAKFDALLTDTGLSEVAGYAGGIGPSMDLIVAMSSSPDDLQISDLVSRAHANGLLVHPYTFRRDQLPTFAEDYNDLLDIFLDKIGVDGVFTDFPDITREYLDNAL